MAKEARRNRTVNKKVSIEISGFHIVLIAVLAAWVLVSIFGGK